MKLFPLSEKYKDEIVKIIENTKETNNFKNITVIRVKGPLHSGKTQLVKNLPIKYNEDFDVIECQSLSKVIPFSAFDNTFFERGTFSIKKFINLSSTINTIDNLISNNLPPIDATTKEIISILGKMIKNNNLIIIAHDINWWDPHSLSAIVHFMKYVEKYNKYKHKLFIIATELEESKTSVLCDYSIEIDYDYSLECFTVKDKDKINPYVPQNIDVNVFSDLVDKCGGNVGMALWYVHLVETYNVNYSRCCIQNFKKDELIEKIIELIDAKVFGFKDTFCVLSSFNDKIPYSTFFALCSQYFSLSKHQLGENIKQNVRDGIKIKLIEQHDNTIHVSDQTFKKVAYKLLRKNDEELIKKWHEYIVEQLEIIEDISPYDIYIHLKNAGNDRTALEYFCVHCIGFSCNGNELNDEDKGILSSNTEILNIYNCINELDINRIEKINVELYTPLLRIEINYAKAKAYYKNVPTEKCEDIIDICSSYMNEPTIPLFIRFRFAWLLMIEYINILDDLKSARSIYNRIYAMCDGKHTNADVATYIKFNLIRSSAAFLSPEDAKRIMEEHINDKSNSIKDSIMLYSNISGCNIVLGKYEESKIQASKAFKLRKYFPWLSFHKVINNYFVARFYILDNLHIKQHHIKIFKKYINNINSLSGKFWLGMNLQCMEEIVNCSKCNSEKIFPMPEGENKCGYTKLLVFYNRITHDILNMRWNEAKSHFDGIKKIIPSICVHDVDKMTSRKNMIQEILEKKIEFNSYEDLRNEMAPSGQYSLWKEPYMMSDLQYWSEL